MSGVAAARAGAALFVLPERGVAAVTGSDRVRWLDGMLTCDVRSLSAGGAHSGAHGLALTREGRIVAELHVLARESELALELERDAIAPLLAHLGRYVVADDVALRDASADWERLALEGPEASALLERALGRALPLAADGCGEAELAGARIVAAAYSLSGLGGRQILAPAGAGPTIRDALLAAGAAPGSAADLEELRVEHGVPRQGRELTTEVLPAEARLEGAVSETKGCYTGQEVVTRMRSRGRAAHLLVGLRFAGGLPAPGSEVRAEGRVVGSVTSAVHSARLGAIGLGFVRRGHDEPGSALEASGYEARVEPLPFPEGARGL
jgi:folate-binding protein YgfZ